MGIADGLAGGDSFGELFDIVFERGAIIKKEEKYCRGCYPGMGTHLQASENIGEEYGRQRLLGIERGWWIWKVLKNDGEEYGWPRIVMTEWWTLGKC